MAGIDEVLERLVADGDFRAALARDPAAALADYDLTRGDVELLASRLDDGDAAERTVEQRTSKSAMLALLASFAGPGGGGAAGPKHEDQIEVLSWSWGETQGGDATPDDLAVPDDAADELYNKSKGNVEWSWKVEEGVKAEVDPDALTSEVDPGTTAPDTTAPDTTAPGAPSTDDEGIIVINGLQEDGSAEMDDVGLPYGKVEFDEEPLGPALADVGDDPEEAVEAFMKVEDIKGEVPDSGAPMPGEGPAGLGGVKAEVDPEALTHKVEPGGDGDEAGIIINGQSETVAGAEATPPDDGIVGGTLPDDDLVGATPQDDMLGARTDLAAAMDADDVMEIEDA